MTNYDRTANWLKACGKEPSPTNLSVQIGCHLEELAEFISCVYLSVPETGLFNRNLGSILTRVCEDLEWVAQHIKSRECFAEIHMRDRVSALDALCDSEVTGNGVAYLAGFRKADADEAVLASNEAKLVDGKPVLLEGGKIGKPEGWRAPYLEDYV